MYAFLCIKMGAQEKVKSFFTTPSYEYPVYYYKPLPVVIFLLYSMWELGWLVGWLLVCFLLWLYAKYNSSRYRKATERVGGTVKLDCPSDFIIIEMFSKIIHGVFFLWEKSIHAHVLGQSHCVAATSPRHCPGLAMSSEVTGEIKQVQVTWNPNFCLVHNPLRQSVICQMELE